MEKGKYNSKKRQWRVNKKQEGILLFSKDTLE